MYGKVFQQIFDSSIANNFMTRHVFMDMLVLADKNGVVDMTQEAIASRTRVPIDIVTKAIGELESPDNRSRHTDFDGARIRRIDEHRDWGWFIVNYEYYNKLASADAYREQNRQRVAQSRQKSKTSNTDSAVTVPVAVACNGESLHVITGNDGQSQVIGNQSVELPTGFPSTAEEAKALGASIGCPDKFIADTWNKAVARGGRDAKDVPIRSWSHYLAREWSYEQNRISEGVTNGQRPGKRVDCNVGNANDGKHNQYTGVGKVK